jgi:predicted nucleic acid-binding protein
MRQVFVDTGGWFALLDANDPAHADASRWFKDNDLPLVTTDYVFDETITLARMELGHAVAVRFGEKLQTSSWAQLIAVSAEDRKAAWLTFKKYKDQRLSYTDCTSFATMRRLGIHQVATTDKGFKVAGFTPVFPW